MKFQALEELETLDRKGRTEGREEAALSVPAVV
jgi:hypothetical protein